MRLLRILLPLLAFLIGSATVSAQYNPTNPPEPGVNFKLTTRCNPADGGSTSPSSAVYAFGSNVTVSVSLNTGFRFVRWEDGEGNTVSTSRSFSYVMPVKDVELTAIVVYDPSNPSEPSTSDIPGYSRITYRVFPAEGGYVSGRSSQTETLKVGSVQRYNAYAYTGFSFVNWTADGEVISTSRSLDYVIPERDTEIVANFKYDPTNPAEPSTPAPYHYLTLLAYPVEAATLYGGGEKATGSNVSISARANQGYNFVNWTDDQGEIVSTTPSFYYIMPDRKVTLTAHYNYDPVNPGEPGTPQPPGSVGENMVAPPRFGMFDESHVMIFCETPGSTIHYTLDGSDPNESSPVYTSPVYVERNLLVKAIAYAAGMEFSPIRSYRVTSYHAAAPVFTFINRKIAITSDTPDAIIRYTLDFSDPDENSEIYTTPLEPEENCRIKAYASKEGLTDSPINLFVFRHHEHTLPIPEFSVNDNGMIVISAGVDGATIRYTVDGSDPDESSTVYTGPIESGEFILKAYSSHINYYDSPIGQYMAHYRVATPISSFSAPYLTFSTSTPGAEIHYTLDGSEPTEASLLYTGPIALSEDCTVKARGFCDGYAPSEICIFEFKRADYTVAGITYNFSAPYLTFSTTTPEAQIHYTLDGSDPTEESPLYTGPLELTGDCVVKARGFRENFFPSEICTFVFTLSENTVAMPTYNFSAPYLTFSTTTPETQIRYTLDGSDPTEESPLYTGPLELTGDCVVKARAFRENFYPSGICTFEFVRTDHTVAMPTYDFYAPYLTFSTTTPEAQIRYTLDGSEPTEESPIYTGPLELTGDCVVKARAFRENFFPSEICTFEFVRTEHTVAIPTYDFYAPYLTFSTTTPEAQIRYTLDGSEPTESSPLYTGPLELSEDCFVKARAFREKFFPSEICTFEFIRAEYTVADITGDFAGLHFYMSTMTPDAFICFTLNGSEPTENSELYRNPIPLTEDCVVLARAYREGFYPSDVFVFEFRKADYTVGAPVLLPDYRNRTITVIPTDDQSQMMELNISGQLIEVPGGYTFEVLEEMSTITAIARSANENLFDSDPVSMELQFHCPPEWDYNGYELYIASRNDDPFPNEAQIVINGSVLGYGTFVAPIGDFLECITWIESDSAFRSLPTDIRIDYFNDGRRAGVRNGRSLEQAFLYDVRDADYYEIVGELDRMDLEFISEYFTSLNFLDLSQAALYGDCRCALEGSSIVNLQLSDIPEGLLRYMPRLCGVQWVGNSKIPDGRINESENPNLLLWVDRSEYAPDDTYCNVILRNKDLHNGSITELHLTPGYPFMALYALQAEKVSFTQEFTQPTEIGVCQGWETIALPFTPQRIVHESNGIITPFASWNGDRFDAKPFWLYTATTDGWQPADSIRAGIPYIISMPFSDEYADDCKLGGRVTFMAENVEIQPGLNNAGRSQWIDGMEFRATFMPVEETVLSLNSYREDLGENGELWRPGSVFTDQAKTLPFGAYVYDPSMRRYAPVFGGSSGLALPVMDQSGLVIETPDAGTIRLTASQSCEVAVYTSTGILIAKVALSPGVPATINGLSRGIYIAGNNKIMVH